MRCKRHVFTEDDDLRLQKLWTRMPLLSIRQIADAMGWPERRVKQRACDLRTDGMNLPKRHAGKTMFSKPVRLEDFPAAQPVTVASVRDGVRTLRRFASVADWRARRLAESVVTTQPMRAKRPAHYGTFRERLEGGRESGWVSVHPTLADGAPMDWRRMLPPPGGGASPAAMCMGEV